MSSWSTACARRCSRPGRRTRPARSSSSTATRASRRTGCRCWCRPAASARAVAITMPGFGDADKPDGLRLHRRRLRRAPRTAFLSTRPSTRTPRVARLRRPVGPGVGRPASGPPRVDHADQHRRDPARVLARAGQGLAHAGARRAVLQDVDPRRHAPVHEAHEPAVVPAVPTATTSSTSTRTPAPAARSCSSTAPRRSARTPTRSHPACASTPARRSSSGAPRTPT